LAGPAGIGKSSLANALRGPVAERRGLLIAGKFDLYRREIPHAAFAAALQSLAHQLAAEASERLALLRRQLQESVGRIGRVLIELARDLQLLLGECPPVPALLPAEARQRLAVAVARLLGAMAARERPLVLVLDDLQWIDAGSDFLLEALLRASEPE